MTGEMRIQVVIDTHETDGIESGLSVQSWLLEEPRTLHAQALKRVDTDSCTGSNASFGCSPCTSIFMQAVVSVVDLR